MEWGSAVIRGSVIDISAEGMRIEIADPLWVGARFSAMLALEPPLRMECVVRRAEPGGGMGVSLVTPEAADRGPLAGPPGAVGNERRPALTAVARGPLTRVAPVALTPAPPDAFR